LLCCDCYVCFFFFFSSRRRHTRFSRDWSSDVCSSDLGIERRVRALGTLELMQKEGHELVAYFYDQPSGLKAIIAVHSTKLGPALGGCRVWPYESEEAALNDVLRLSKGMTYKSAAM